MSVLTTPGWNSIVRVASMRSAGSYSLKATATAPVISRSLNPRNLPRSASPGRAARSTARVLRSTSQRDRSASASSARRRSVMSRTMCTAPTITPPSPKMGSAVTWNQLSPRASSKLSRWPVRSISWIRPPLEEVARAVHELVALLAVDLVRAAAQELPHAAVAADDRAVAVQQAHHVVHGVEGRRPAGGGLAEPR